MKPLTAEQQRVFSFIADRIRSFGMPPAVREIAARFGYRSVNSVRQHLRLIAQKGYIRLIPGKARGIELAVALEKEAHRRREVPLVGAVPAGKPVTAVENVDDYITLDPAIFRGENLFTLRVTGDSMEGIGVMDGDIAVIRQQSTAANNEVVVALIDDEATLKRYIRKKDHIVLRAENPRYDDIVVSSDKEVRIAGKLMGIIRKY